MKLQIIILCWLQQNHWNQNSKIIEPQHKKIIIFIQTIMTIND